MSRRGAGKLGAVRWASVVVALVAVAACDAPPVAWEAPRRTVGAERDSSAAATALAPLPDSAGLRRCDGSVSTAVGRGRDAYAVWWALRPDSSALLLAAYSADSGRSWARTMPVDTLDRSARGCARPAPALAADRVNGYAHVVYWLEAPEGPGVFYAHLMDPRARFEPPAVIVYGRTPAAASVASSGDAVAVAYEDPNRDRPQVELALSRTAGHRFDERSLDVSGGDVEARDPRVALDANGRITVRWTERGGPDAPAVAMERTGVLSAAGK